MTLSHSFPFIVINHRHYLLTHVHLKHDRMECQQLHKYAYATHNQNCSIMSNTTPKGKVRLPKKDPWRDLVQSFLTSKQRLFLKWSALITLSICNQHCAAFPGPGLNVAKRCTQSILAMKYVIDWQFPIN